MPIQIQFRRGTAAQWTSANPLLANGEPGYETDTGKFKVGDGSTYWTSLPYSSGPAGSSGATGATGAGFDGITSTTSRAIANTGTQTFTLNKVGALVVGTRVRIASSANTANYMEGRITDISSLIITVALDNSGGSGTFASWNVTVAGDRGAQGLQGDPGPAGASGISAALVADAATSTGGTTNATTVPAGLIVLGSSLSAGSTFRITAKGYRTGTNNSGATFAVTVNGATVTTLTHANTATAAGWHVDALLTFRSVGGSGTVSGQESLMYNATWLATANSGTTAVDTTSTVTIALVMTAASGTNTYVATQAVYERIQ